MIGIFIAGLLLGGYIIATFDRSVWMQTRRVMYDLDRDGREKLLEIKKFELEDINSSRREYGIEPVVRRSP